ncbi:MAG: hypothetical protein FWG74_09915 [Planctomycetes bacterium]|nr:hypothetical protein [Planctomycetota bacterium]
MRITTRGREQLIKERPILFSGPMVRALLMGEKTQTRRIVKNPDWFERRINSEWRYDGFWAVEDDGDDCHYMEKVDGSGKPTEQYAKIGRCPYGKPDDRLWVRETWRRLKQGVQYHAEYHKSCRELEGPKWRASIHMPRRVSRILLEITDVRVERLQAITEADALAEGMATLMRGCTRYEGEAVKTFEWIWDEINGLGAWATDPLVWVIEFRRLEPA